MNKTRKCTWCGRKVPISTSTYLFTTGLGWVCSAKCKSEKAGRGSAETGGGGGNAGNTFWGGVVLAIIAYLTFLNGGNGC